MSGALKAIVHWLVYAGLAVVAGGFMLLGKIDTVLVDRIRLQLSDPVVPILDAVSVPVDEVAGALNQVHGWLLLAEENDRLRTERDRLLQWKAVAERLDAENAGLRKLLKLVPDGDASFFTARVIADSTGAFAHSVLINAGDLMGASRGQIVLTGDGLAGRVVGVSQRASRVLLITDLNSRVPVLVGPKRIRAVLAGDNTDQPKLAHLGSDGAPAVGDEVITSGVAGVFPPGLPIGTVDAVDDGKVSIKPNFDRSRLEYVRVVDFGQGLAADVPPSLGEPGPRKQKPSVRADAR